MDEECYPAISMNTATNGHGPRKYQQTAHVNGTTVLGQPPELEPAAALNLMATQNRTLHHHTYAAAAGRGRSGGLADDDGDHLSEDNEDSEDSSFDSDEVDIDEPMIKEEPLSPGSSCPSSPVLHGNNTRSKSKMLNNINLSQMAALTNTDLVFEHAVSGELFYFRRALY